MTTSNSFLTGALAKKRKLSIMDKILYYINFEINKHGHCGPHNDAEGVVNSMSNMQLLELIVQYLEDEAEAEARGADEALKVTVENDI